MMDKKGDNLNSFGIAAVILGILSIVSTLGQIAPGVLLGIVGIVFAIKQKRVSKNSWSKAGLILSILGIILNIVALLVSVYYIFPYLNNLPSA